MKYLYATVFALLLAFGCVSDQGHVLFKNSTSIGDNAESLPLSQLLSDRVRLIPLETNDSILIGRINKIKKFEGHYFVLADEKQVFRFDETGKYLGSLNKRGEGPEEYTSIIDFDVYQTNGVPEVWIADYAKIKRYDAVDFSFKSEVSFPFFVNKFRRVGEDALLLMSGEGENSLFITDLSGAVQHAFLPKEFPFLMFRPVQFKQYRDSLFLFQLGVSNDFVCYNSDGCNFDYGSFFTANNGLLTKDVLKEMYEQDGIDYLGKLNQTNCIKSFAPFGSAMCFNLLDKETICFSKEEDSSATLSVKLKPARNVLNDLFDLPDLSFLLSLGFAESDDSLLFFVNPSSFCDGATTVTLHDGTAIEVLEDDNPLLIEFF